MTGLAFSPAAVRDIEQIGDYIAKDSVSHAQKFVARIKAQCNKVANSPLSYPARNDLISGVRMAALGRYLIFFLVTDDEVRIERVLHGARDLQDLFNYHQK